VKINRITHLKQLRSLYCKISLCKVSQWKNVDLKKYGSSASFKI